MSRTLVTLVMRGSRKRKGKDMIFYKKRYQGALEKIEDLEIELKRKDKELENYVKKMTNENWNLLNKNSKEHDKNLKLDKENLKLKKMNEELTINNSDLSFKIECICSENKELKKEISNYKRRVTNLKKTRILKGTKEQKQIIKVKLGASTKTTVRKHLKKEIEEVKSND